VRGRMSSLGRKEGEEGKKKGKGGGPRRCTTVYPEPFAVFFADLREGGPARARSADRAAEGAAMEKKRKGGRERKERKGERMSTAAHAKID